MVETYTNARNPILPIRHHFPDCEAHVMPDGRLYVYGSYDGEADTYCSTEYRVFSTADLTEWSISDVSFRAEQATWVNDPNAPKYKGIDFANPSPFMKKRMEDMLANMTPEQKAAMEERRKEMFQRAVHLYAPDAIHRDGKYYLYFCLSGGSGGVAVADDPNGPFVDAKQLPVGEIDPAIFIDDDGQAYYYWGQFSAKGGKLKDDMVTLQESTVVEGLVTEEEHFFHEGSSMRKRNGIYYLVYADMSRGKPTSLGYATSRSPLGPFTYGGVIIDNADCDPASWNNHGSIEEFHGKWYVFYHRCSRGTEFHRRVCIEPIEFGEDGSIKEVRMTSQGAGAPYAAGEIIPAYAACGLSGSAYLAPHGEGEALMNIADGDTALFRYIQADDPIHSVCLVAEGCAEVEIWLDDALAGRGSIRHGRADISMNVPAGLYTLKARFVQPRDLKLISLRFA